MIKRNILITLIILLAIVVSINFLDGEIAIIIMEFIRSIRTINKATESIPDILPYFVVVVTFVMWTYYFYRSRKKKFDKDTQFLKLAATVLPLAYLVKTISKFVFGRIGPRDWLIHHESLTFHWLKIWSSSFPSGHMVVFVAFGTAILFYYPRYHRLVLSFLILLGVALIATDYHFLSDVIAGAYIGYVTTYFTNYIYEKQRLKF